MAVAAALAVVAGACGDQSTGFDGAAADDLDAAVERQVAAATAGGVVVRVVSPDGQRTIAAGPAGVDGELTGDEAFRIASITKMFTAAIALQLAEEGAVDLDAPIADMVPEQAALLEHGSEITLRQLLGHTSGLPVDPDPEDVDDPWKLHLEIVDGAATVACDDVEPYIRLHRAVDAVFEPGTDFGYSNMGYRIVRWRAVRRRGNADDDARAGTGPLLRPWRRTRGDLGDGTIGHPGAAPGYNSRLSYDPERKIVIVELSNETPNRHRTPLATQVAHAVQNVLVRHDQTD